MLLKNNRFIVIFIIFHIPLIKISNSVIRLITVVYEKVAEKIFKVV